MPSKLIFYGGVGEVTGSRHLLESGRQRVLLDCGLFQGHRHEALQKNMHLPFDPRGLAAVLLSHAHIDHSGGLPLLTKKGMTSSIHCTGPTADLCSIMLMDSAHLQEEDAKFFNKIHAKDGSRIEPLYDSSDAKAALDLLQRHEYEQDFALGENLAARFLNAGHVLGSAMIQVDAQTDKGRRRIVFTGDLGRRQGLLMKPPAIAAQVDYLIIESTYGNRSHDPIDLAEKRLAEVVNETAAQKGKLLIPSFALERTQEILFILQRLFRANAIAPLPVYVDSPMANSITKVFAAHLDCFCFSAEFKAAAAKLGDPFGLKSVRLSGTAQESKAINDLSGPLAIIAGSGMCEGGRILHHLRNNIAGDNTTILLVGYQAAGTLGRRLQEGAKKVKIFGLEHEVWAKVETIPSFSAHADKDDLLWFISGLNPPPRKIFLVHGDPEQRRGLAEQLKAAGIDRVASPEFGESFDLA